MPETDLIFMSLVIFLPSICAACLLLFPSRAIEGMRWWAVTGMVANLILSLCILVDYYSLLDSHLDPNGRPLHAAETRLENRVDDALAAAYAPVPGPRLAQDWVARLIWIEQFDIHYFLGIDGISLPLILLTNLVGLLAVIASWTITTNVKAYLGLLLVLQTGVLGAFMALDFFLFYVFYELMLIPMYFLIGLWGGSRRKTAATKFVVYTLLGSVLILASLVGLYAVDVRDYADAGLVDRKAEMRLREMQAVNPKATLADARREVTVHSFDFVTLARAGRAASLHLHGRDDRIAGPKTTGDQLPLLRAGAVEAREEVSARLQQPFFSSKMQYWLFALLFLGFAIKVPIFPLHNWLPDAHVEAPTPISMILAGVLLKLGGYGLLRVAYPICPWAAEQLAFTIGLIGVIGIVYGALVALGQTDFKKLLAYSSISHMGYVILGLAVWASAAESQYWAWGMNGAMFQMVAHGITSAGLFFVVGVIYERAHHREIAKFGGLMEPMPFYSGMSVVLFFASMGLPGLCGFVGEFAVLLAAWHFNPWFAVAAAATTILTAGYLLWTWQRVYLGTNFATSGYPDVDIREAICLLPFVGFSIALGVWPNLLMSWMEPSTTALVESLARLRG